MIPVILLLSLVIVSTVGCIKPEESPIYTYFDDNPELTMSVYLWKDNHFRAAARLYEEKTGIKVNIQNNFDFNEEFVEYMDTAEYWLNPYPDVGMYTEKTLASLTTGRGADIYDLSWLDFERLGRNGLLVDIAGWLENDAELSEKIVFRDILLSGKTEHGIFAAPLDFQLRKLATYSADEPLLENKRMTWKEFFDEAERLDYTKDRFYVAFDFQIFMERFISRASDFIDEDENTNNLYSEDMISLLEECKEWRDLGLCADARNPTSYYDWGSYGYIVVFDYDIADMLCTIPDEYRRDDITIIAPIPSDAEPVYADGNVRYPELIAHNFAAGSYYGVNAGSPNAEAAQVFLRFLLTEEGQDKMQISEIKHFGLPVNRTVFRDAIERDLDRILPSYIVSEHGVPTITPELDFPALINEAEEHVNQIAYIIIEKPYYRFAVFEPARAFFLNEISAEEAARQMSDKVGLYLKELG